MDFAELGLSEKTIKAITEAGITTPTTVQADVIPSILAGKDVFTIAPARCGKTCSYVLPLIDIISRHEAKNILIITAGSKQSVNVSDHFAVFNKYHEITESTVTDSQESIDEEANVIIASPNLLVDLMKEGKVDLSTVDILVIDDINLIKKIHQLKSLQTVLEALPADKQNIIFTNRRSKETQMILDQILQAPDEIKVDKNKEEEAVQSDVEPKKVEDIKKVQEVKSEKKAHENPHDYEAVSLMKRYRTFGRQTPEFLLTKIDLAEEE
jgi:superfamily II DNA/RNA helicase